MDNYMKFEMIGKGSNGTKVYLVKNLLNNKEYAMKKVSNSISSSEVQILKSLRPHPHILQHIESFSYKSNKFCLVTEFFKNGDLSSYISHHHSLNIPINEKLILKWIYQLTQAISFLHLNGIIHNDIKPANIFLTDNYDVILGDFGIAIDVKKETPNLTTPLGTPLYLPPERCEGKECNFNSDMWMLGCVIYELVTLTPPFSGNNFPEIMRNILFKDYPKINNKIYSEKLLKIIDLLLNKISEERPSPNDLIEILFKKKNCNFRLSSRIKKQLVFEFEDNQFHYCL